MAEVICVGVAFLDYVFESENPMAVDGKTFAHDHHLFGGGMAATAAASIAKLGGVASFWGRLGDDETGARILDGLSRHGVYTEQVRRVHGALSPVSSVLIGPGGERHITVFAGRDLDPDASWLPYERIEDTGAILVDSRWPEAAMGALQRAHEHRIPAILDGEVGPEPVPRELVELSSHVIFSRAGLLQYTGSIDISAGLSKAAESTEGMVGVTAGAEGFYWLDEDGVQQHLAALDVTAVDTLGAGDVFHGAFALAISEEKDIETAARFANIAAGLKCSRPGGRAGIPGRAEVWQILEADVAA